jgi:flavin reductase like protein
MNGTPTPPSEFDLPLAGTAVWAGPEGIGDDSRFDDVPAPQAVELPPDMGDDPPIALRRTLGMFATGVTVITTRFEVIHDTPLVEGALAHFVANVNRSYWGGDHSLFLGRVEYARYAERGTPLLFHGGRYERLGQVSYAAATLPNRGSAYGRCVVPRARMWRSFASSPPASGSSSHGTADRALQ